MDKIVYEGEDFFRKSFLVEMVKEAHRQGFTTAGIEAFIDSGIKRPVNRTLRAGL